jgi:hypothetical protein
MTHLAFSASFGLREKREPLHDFPGPSDAFEWISGETRCAADSASAEDVSIDMIADDQRRHRIMNHFY